MLRIGEFSALSSISIHMLRNYDKIALLIPQHVDDVSGYRYYDKEQLLQANQIIALKSMGLGLEEIKEILFMQQSNTNALLQVKLQDKLRELEKTKEQIRQIQTAMDMEKRADDYAFSIVRKKIAPVWVAALRGTIQTYPEEGTLWGRLESMCQDHKIKLYTESPVMAIYHGIDENSGMMDVEVQFPLEKEYKTKGSPAIFQIPERETASVIFKGCYSQIGAVNRVVAEWLEKNQLEVSGQAFSIYHNSPGNCPDDKSFVTELCFPVKEKI